MHIKLYQICLARDKNHVAFKSTNILRSYNSSYPTKLIEIDSSIYDLVYQGWVSCDNLEEVFDLFNNHIPGNYLAYPVGYKGRSLSVSDVVEVVSYGTENVSDKNESKSDFFFCDSFGFTPVLFTPEEMKKGNTVTNENNTK